MKNKTTKWIAYMVRRFLRYHCGQWKWARKLIGGRWEEWWVDSCVDAHVWLHEPRYLTGQNRPGGCAIWADEPKPRRTEVYSENEVDKP